MINTGVLSHPLNWLTVAAMVTILVIGAHVALLYIHQPKSQPVTS
jgi:hypothetical protein